MKKLLTLLLTLSLVLALCACGQSGSIAPAEEPAAAEEPAQEPTAEEPADEDLPRGTITEKEDGVRYENSFLGFACELDENWYIYNEEELAQTAGIVSDQFDGTDYEELLKDTPVFYDFFGARVDGMATINVNFSYAGPAAQLLVMDQYLDAMIPQFKNVVEAGGMTDVSIEKNTVSFAGSEYEGLLMHAKTQGIDYYAQQIYFVVGPRISTLTLGTFLEDNTADLLALFQPLD